MQPNPNNWIEMGLILVNSGILIMGFKLIRNISRMELKLELMWNHFEKHGLKLPPKE